MANEPDADRLRRGDRVLFVSDVHLTPAEPENFLLFLRFLEEEAAGARSLYLLGDIFDFWVGPRQAELPAFDEVFRRTRALRESGTDVYFQAGNRDFLLDGAFAGAHGLRLLPDVAEVMLGDRRVALTHGDLLCTRDVRYLRMRRVVRSRVARAVAGRLPLSLALRLAGGFRDASGREIASKPAYVLDPDFEEIRAWLERGYDALVFGHVHRGERYRVDLGDRVGDVLILDSWENVANYVEWDGREIRFRRYRPGPKSLGRASGPDSLVRSSPDPGPAPAPGPNPAPGRAMAERRVIAIDGPAGSGKSTVARRLADRLGYRYLDSGAMYRALTVLARRRGVDPGDEKALAALDREAAIELTDEGVRLDGEDVSREIRSPEISRMVSRVATAPAVREGMVARQRSAWPGENLVVEGRDIGSVVFPDADVKIFLTASAQERARRRAEDTGQSAEEVLSELEERDDRDTRREHSPLVRAAGAEELDTTGMTIEEVVQRLRRIVTRSLGG